MYIEDPNQIYGCVNCHSIMGEIKEDSEDGIYRCAECGEATIIPFLGALYMVNDMMEQGHIKLVSEEDFDIAQDLLDLEILDDDDE